MLITYQTCMFRSWGFFCFHSCFSNLLFFLWEKKCMCSWVAWYFRFSFWVLISVYVFMLGVCIAGAQLGNGPYLTVCTRHLHPAFPMPVCKSKTDVPDMIFTFSLSFEWVRILFTLQIFLCQCCSRACFLSLFFCVCLGGLWFLHFFSAFIFLWMVIKRQHPSEGTPYLYGSSLPALPSFLLISFLPGMTVNFAHPVMGYLYCRYSYEVIVLYGRKLHPEQMLD